jgi:DNA modification methylase
MTWTEHRRPFGDDPPTARVNFGTHAIDAIRDLPDASVDAVVTELPTWQKRSIRGLSPESWGAVSYRPMAGIDPISIPACRTHLGLENDVRAYVGHVVDVFREIRRVLRRTGSVWVLVKDARTGSIADVDEACELRPRNLVGTPHRLALALQGDGWYWRSDPVWYESNRLPNARGGRPSDVHHHIFFGSHPDGGGDPWYDTDALREPHQYRHMPPGNRSTEVSEGHARRPVGDSAFHPAGRNRRSVFEVKHGFWRGAQEGPWPIELVEPFVQASVPPGGTVLDPFCGSGVTAQVALANGRNFVGCDINPRASDEFNRRIEGTRPTRKGSEESNAIASLFQVS